jgi:hypothetical protein
MATQSVRFFDRSKFLWDGESYDSRPAAEAKKGEYEAQGFESHLIEEDGEVLLYTRRVVKEIVIEGETPPA